MEREEADAAPSLSAVLLAVQVGREGVAAAQALAVSWRKRMACAQAAELRAEPVWGLIREKAAKAAQACSAWPASRARLCVYVARCTLSLDHDLRRPASSAGEGPRRILGLGECSCRDGGLRGSAGMLLQSSA
jgi:hypothetical protein